MQYIYIYAYTTRQKWFQDDVVDDDDRVTTAYVLIKHTYDAKYAIPKKEIKRQREGKKEDVILCPRRS